MDGFDSLKITNPTFEAVQKLKENTAYLSAM